MSKKLPVSTKGTSAALAANLAKVAKPEIVKHYEQLVAMENATLDDSSGVGGGSRGTGN